MLYAYPTPPPKKKKKKNRYKINDKWARILFIMQIKSTIRIIDNVKKKKVAHVFELRIGLYSISMYDQGSGTWYKRNFGI